MKRSMPKAGPANTGLRQGRNRIVPRNPRRPARRAAISNEAKIANAGHERRDHDAVGHDGVEPLPAGGDSRVEYWWCSPTGVESQ